MALTSLLSFFIVVTLLIRGLSAQIAGEQNVYWQSLQRQQQHKLQARTDCRVERLTAQEPTIRFESEAGLTEFWERNNQQFECAGVAAVRNVIQPRGLLLPHYNNAPQLLYVVRGRGILGTVIPGCPETFERDIQPRQDRQRRFMDQHQKVRQFRQGDVLALPAGFTLWFYNNGGEPLVTVALLDTGNAANQLDQTFRHFFLAGNPQGGRQSYFGRRETQEQEGRTNNIFNGFDDEILADAFGVDVQTARRLKGQDDMRGRIVRAERFNIVFPGQEAEERWERDQPYSPANGFEETLCTAKLRENLDEPTRADVYNPRGGRISSLNSLTLPILSWLRLSAEKGVLYRNGLVAPHWNVNAHSIVYITRGSGRFQVVGPGGRSVFDGEVREGQLIIVPQNYVVAKRASEDEGLEWIAFKTNDNAMTSQLAGRLSAIRAMPEEVVMTAYGVSREEARRLKYNREESRVFSSRSRYSPRSSRPMSHMPKPFEYAMDVIKSMM
ncbi:11S globulin seed storage protein 1 [Sesamum alatum]|uniref:11S globulin seed storage protein 1 n=1 Tax=Sesamum alatum TaxID=300844 RepID=A0AAE1YCL4_9LAMI|nr:11S globulin seed storage protein 1 [Sesamum alatum]